MVMTRRRRRRVGVRKGCPDGGGRGVGCVESKGWKARGVSKWGGAMVCDTSLLWIPRSFLGGARRYHTDSRLRRRAVHIHTYQLINNIYSTTSSLSSYTLSSHHCHHYSLLPQSHKYTRSTLPPQYNHNQSLGPKTNPFGIIIPPTFSLGLTPRTQPARFSDVGQKTPSVPSTRQ